MKTIITTLLVFTTAYTFAQPVLSAADVTPVAGEKFKTVNFSDAAAGSGGNNKTWNFGTINPNTIIDTTEIAFVSPSSTPFASTFNSSGLALNLYNSEYEFFITGNIYQSAGNGYYDQQGNESFAYNNNKDLLRFPLNTTTNFTDTYGGQSTSQGITTKTDGTIHAFVDGWGTITTPSGTFSNVLRVVSIDSSKSFYTGSGFNDSSQSITLSYKWFRQGTHQPVFSVDSLFDNDVLYVSGSYLINAIGTSLENNPAPIGFSVYPNPVTNELRIDMDDQSLLEPVQIELYRLDGALAKTIIVENKNNIKLDLSELPVSSYLVKVNRGKDIYYKIIVKQ